MLASARGSQRLQHAWTPPAAGANAAAIVDTRDLRVVLDEDLARLYGVTTARLNQAVKRNARRFPMDFAFQLNRAECRILRSQSVISSGGHGGRRTRPWAFTEHGAIMAATVVSSQRAIEMSIFVVRAFLRLRSAAATHRALADKLDDLEGRSRPTTRSSGRFSAPCEG